MQCSWSSQHTYPKAQNTVKEWGEWGAPLTSGDFGGIGLRPWFERPLSLFDTFHTGGPAGIWDKPCGLKPCGVAVTFLQSDQATRSVYGMLVSTQTVTHSVLSEDFFRSSDFWFRCWSETWSSGAVFRNYRLQPEPCNAQSLSNFSCFSWVW